MAANTVSLEDFDDDFPTQKPTGYKSGDFELSDLTDGEYLFHVASAAIKDGKIFKMELELLTEGPLMGGKIEKPYFFFEKNKATGQMEKNERQRGQLNADLTKLGFDPENWTRENNRLVSRELPKVPAAMIGMHIVCVKKTGDKKNDGSYWQNLYIERRGEGDGKPAKIGARELEEANFDPLA